MVVGESTKPRYEFRSFGQNFDSAWKRMARLKSEYAYEEFMEIIRSHPDLQAVRINKLRYGYMVNDTICEYGIVLINGARVVTINSESIDIENIKKTIRDIGLEGIENINYLQAIKRVIGMIDKPLANEIL